VTTVPCCGRDLSNSTDHFASALLPGVAGGWTTRSATRLIFWGYGFYDGRFHRQVTVTDSSMLWKARHRNGNACVVCVCGEPMRDIIRETCERAE
jgi:hypothetical protein